MSQMYLASEINITVKHIAGKIGDISKLKAVFINTAGEPSRSNKNPWEEGNINGFREAGFEFFDYTLTGKNLKQLEKDLGDCDLIHVNGGNTFYLLLQIRKSGFKQFIKRQIGKGVIYTGSSAGSITAGPDIEPAKKLDSEIYAEQLKTFEGMNLVDFVILPHWGRADQKELYLTRRLEQAFNDKNKLILLNDNQYIAVTDGKYEIVDIRKDF